MQVRYVLHAGIGEVATADLRSAFEQVACHRRASQLVPIGFPPAVVRNRRADRERGIGHTTGDDDLRAGIECGGDRKCALVDIGADEAALVESAFEAAADDLLAAGAREIVALDHRDARCCEAEFLCEPQDQVCGRARIGGAEVADDRDLVLQAVGQDRPQFEVEQHLVTRIGIGLLRQLRQRERALGQHLEHHDCRPAALDQRAHDRAGRIDPVAREAGAAPDRKEFLAGCVHAEILADRLVQVNQNYSNDPIDCPNDLPLARARTTPGQAFLAVTVGMGPKNIAFIRSAPSARTSSLITQ